MFFGQPFGAFGDPDKHVKDMQVESTSTGIRIRLLASDNIGDSYYQIYINNIFAAVVYCPEGVYSDWTSLVLPTANSYQITTFRVGSESSIDQSVVAAFYDTNSTSVTASWTWDYEVIGTNDNNYLSSWTINSLSFAQVAPATKNTRGEINVTMSVTGGTASVVLGNLASGSGAVGGSITLSAINDSGVTGSVTVAADAVTSTGTLAIRWPTSMNILRDDTSPPTTQIANVLFNQSDNGSYVDTDVDVGTYYYAYRAVSDTDDVGDQSTAQEVNVTGAPDAPEDLAYSSGNYTNTVVSFTGSETSGATYNVYVQNPDDSFLDTETPATTAIAGSTSVTLPTITGYPGFANVLIRAVYSGVEELNYDILRLEYDSSGAIILPRPNVPTVASIVVSDGLTATTLVDYNDAAEAATATKINIYTRTQTGSYNFGVIDATGALAENVDGRKIANIAYSFSAPGWYYITAKAATVGDQECAGYAAELAVYVDDTNVTAPTGTFTVNRG